MENLSTYHASILDERLQAQAARIDLMKWKLIIVAAIGSAGLGFFKQDGINNAFSIIIFIPFCCLYVDLLCRKLSLRSLKINIFLARYPESSGSNIDIDFFKSYQDLRGHPNAKDGCDDQGCKEPTKKDILGLMGPNSQESLALIVSSLFLTIFVTVAGALISTDRWIKILFLISGVVCMVASLIIEYDYRQKKKEILPPPIKLNPRIGEVREKHESWKKGS
ncbi:MAG: hypothetical protein ABI091_27800 [Ferruginibacter sp.]